MPDPVNAEDDLVDRLTRMVAEPAWQRYYMDKDEAALCIAALEAVRSTRDGEIERLREALQFYANEWDEHEEPSNGLKSQPGFRLLYDEGDIAREALNQGTPNVG